MAGPRNWCAMAVLTEGGITVAATWDLVVAGEALHLAATAVITAVEFL